MPTERKMFESIEKSIRNAIKTLAKT